MKNIPTWLKVVLAILVFALLYGGAQILLHVDKASTGRFGLD
jgi:type VI protein secretion system component VasF